MEAMDTSAPPGPAPEMPPPPSAEGAGNTTPPSASGGNGPGMPPPGRGQRGAPAPPSNKLYVGNLREGTPKAAIEELFSKWVGRERRNGWIIRLGYLMEKEGTDLDLLFLSIRVAFATCVARFASLFQLALLFQLASLVSLHSFRFALSPRFARFRSSRHGAIASVEMKHGGFAFVEYTDLRDAEDAVLKLNRTPLEGSEIRVEFAKRTFQRAPGESTCYLCQKSGHWARECPENANPGMDVRSGNCFKCGRPGHLAKQCR